MDYKIYKYATGGSVPENARYLTTIKNGDTLQESHCVPPNYQFVWHYFLIPVKESE